MRLNEQTVKALVLPPEGVAAYIQRDEEDIGFAVRITARGRKAFLISYSIGGRERRMNIGRWPAWSVTAARAKSRELRREIDNGIDPLEEKRVEREAPTVADIAAEYLERHAAKLKSGNKLVEYVNRDILPEWGKLKASDIRRRDVIELVEAKAARTPTAGNMLLGVVNNMFNWSIENDVFPGPNPAFKVKRPAAKVARDRWLTEAEIRQFWERLDDAAMAPECRAALRLILITGQRSGEVLSMERAEVSLPEARWTIPGPKAKNKLQHDVPLSSMAAEIISALPPTDRWMFPSPTTGNHLTVAGLSTTIARNQAHFGLARFTPHDLRRSCATMMTRAGIPQLVVGKILNHVERGVTKVYDRNAYDLEKRDALEKWASVLRRILGAPAPAKVVELTSRRRS